MSAAGKKKKKRMKTIYIQNIYKVQASTGFISCTGQGSTNGSRKSKAHHHSTQAVLCPPAERRGGVRREVQVAEWIADGGGEFPFVFVSPFKPEIKF